MTTNRLSQRDVAMLGFGVRFGFAFSSSYSYGAGSIGESACEVGVQLNEIGTDDALLGRIVARIISDSRSGDPSAGYATFVRGIYEQVKTAAEGEAVQ